MSSFHKASETRLNIVGTKLKNGLPFVSSGIPSLDHVIGGGLPSGGIFAVEEDILGTYSRVLLKYYLAEGIACKHGLFIASVEEDPHLIVQELPLPCNISTEDEVSSAVDKMKIAWRYEGLNQVESSFGGNNNLGHNFDLSRHIDSDVIQNSNIIFYDLNDNQENVKGFKNPMYYQLLNKIKEAVSQEEFSSTCESKNILRIGIHSLGSPTWMAMDCDEESDVQTYGQDLIKFIYCLRILLRDTSAVAFITIPTHLFDDETIMKRILYSVDNAVQIESFAGSSKETNPVYKDYHGLFHIRKISALYSLVPFVPPSLDLAFKLKRKKFIIEKLHLPPELQETSEREQDDIVTPTTMTCGGFKKKDIDF